ncbi:S-adenosyl-L-methionine-dependent methyltransferase [Talaromyces proteolyticus]|uniref:S-adenosyl-L-methionine-dependent methyltransferase n=1 Tax=Talaromyces proteolyticus TaxID=1131652 RepID=A0AAD4KGY9_9EURO|nr:S-adenosyl-L-methionine-dependent methyltransferase [Talaromyces proteolyticus]KAH8691924.1 S-adenosyl-L-methionine-dependent methyltransferase [Talaromyces proteolyticus]
MMSDSESEDSAIDVVHVVDFDSTTSLDSTVLKSVNENGRQYQDYRYILPKDEKEQERQRQGHALLYYALGDLHNCPLTNPQKVLDIGTGVGIWSTKFADKYKSAVVLGIDISYMQPQYVPPNLSYLIVDAWEFVVEEKHKGQYDFIYIGQFAGAVRDWRSFLQHVIQLLKPGGWLKWIEMGIGIHHKHHHQTEALVWWENQIRQASENLGTALDVGPYMGSFLQQAGFRETQVKEVNIPLGTPSESPHKRLALLNEAYTLSTVEPLSLRLLGSSWDMVICALVKKDIRQCIAEECQTRW